ncbi:hypothetical protein M413DRAFT_147511 [Hebeloma cylindrosporum]|uniref:Autophagy-related protein 13 n=1 Tax=Hebeloma cylindrosporum TaxID=76867 RepID=A0A0C2XUN8_HEBCY|nr:hypothetical protein M413DRAFT_147511 [Hebeloma cylindrosporum h7]
MYWYEYETDTDELPDNTLTGTSPPARFLPDLEKYRTISKIRGLGVEPMIIEVILGLPQPIILETWQLSLTGQSDANFMEKGLFYHLVKMYEERRKFYWGIRICLNKLPKVKFIGRIHDSHMSFSPDTPIEIALRLSSGSGNGIEKQFVSYGSEPLPIQTYTSPPISHIYGDFVLSVICLTDSSRLLVLLCCFDIVGNHLKIKEQGGPSLTVSGEQEARARVLQRSRTMWAQKYPSPDGEAMDKRKTVKERGDFFPSIYGKQAEKTKTPFFLPARHPRQTGTENRSAKSTSKKVVPLSGISELRRRMMVDPDGCGKLLAERQENFHTVPHNPDSTLDVEPKCPPSPRAHANLPSTSRDRAHLRNLNVSARYILQSSVDKFNDPTLSLVNVNAHDIDSEGIPPDEPQLPDSTRFGIPIPPKKIRIRDDYQNPQWWLKHIIQENMRSRRRAINSASTADSRPSPMISGFGSHYPELD